MRAEYPDQLDYSGFWHSYHQKAIQTQPQPTCALCQTLTVSNSTWQILATATRTRPQNIHVFFVKHAESDYSGFWQQLPSESYPNSASTYMCSLSNTDSQQLNLPGLKTYMCSSSNTQSQQLSPAARGTWCSGITSAPHAEGLGFNPQCVPCLQSTGLLQIKKFHWSTTSSSQTYLFRHGKAF